jgi:CheY-like chemotaxis protein
MKEVHILLVEDNEGDIILTLEALKETTIKNRVTVARNGEKAVTMLNEAEELPDMILLDINLPKVDGLEVLATIKSDERLKMIPVIMLSTSSSDKDVNASYAHHANCFISKPVDLSKFIEVVRTIENFWISIVRLPQQNRHEAISKY